MEHSWKGNTNQEDVRDRQPSEEEETNKQEEYRECLKLWNFLWFWNMGFIHYTLPQPLSQCTTPRPSLAISWEPRARVFVFNLFCSTMLEPWPSHMINKFSITALYPQPSFVFFTLRHCLKLPRLALNSFCCQAIFQLWSSSLRFLSLRLSVYTYVLFQCWLIDCNKCASLICEC